MRQLVVYPGPKSKERLEQKVQRGKAPQGITDRVRGGFDVATPEQADEIVASLSASFEIADEGWTRTRTGYFDRKVMVRFPNGQVGEVQVWPPGCSRPNPALLTTYTSAGRNSIQTAERPRRWSRR
jgi:hypothetical protein